MHSMSKSDPFQNLVSRAKEGDESAMEELYEAFFDKIYFYVVKRVDGAESAEDITGDVFFEVVRRLKDFEGRSSFSTWVYAIAKNKIADFWREKYALQTVPLEEYLAHEEEESMDAEMDFEAAEQEWQKLHLATVDLLNHLQETPRKLLELRFLQNYTLDEAAEELNMSKNTAKVTQFRALKKLRSLAEKNIISPPKK